MNVGEEHGGKTLTKYQFVRALSLYTKLVGSVPRQGTYEN